MNKDDLESKGFYTINKLSELTGADRLTIKKHLATEAHTFINVRLFMPK